MIPKITAHGVTFITEDRAEQIPVYDKMIERYSTLIAHYETQYQIQDNFIVRLQKINKTQSRIIKFFVGIITLLIGGYWYV